MESEEPSLLSLTKAIAYYNIGESTNFATEYQILELHPNTTQSLYNRRKSEFAEVVSAIIISFASFVTNVQVFRIVMDKRRKQR